MLDEGTRYPGGKGAPGFADWIVGHLPAHVFYAEPFAGKGAVYRAKPPALKTVLVDQDSHVVDWWARRPAPGRVVLEGDGIRFVELAADLGVRDLVLYCDPPYLHSTRSRRRIYRREMTDAQHERLLQALVRLRCPALISGYDSPLYREQLAGWQHTTREVMTRGGVLRTESLWSNWRRHQGPPPAVAVNYADLGADYRERENNAKLLRRWRERFTSWPYARQRAVLLELLDAHNERPSRASSRTAGGVD